MAEMKAYLKRFLMWSFAIVPAGIMLLPAMAPAQEEVASALRRYKGYEASTGYYEEYEVRPRRQSPFIVSPGVGEDPYAYSPTAAIVRSRRHLADSHRGIEFYEHRRCEDCHIRETRDIHTVRANLTCRQCHGGEPIASNDHYFSPMNPIRRHAYVCAKCHEGASASFAGYVVHAPNPALADTRREFPALFYAFWIMIAVAVGTFVVFLPHTGLWGIRELFVRKEKKGESSDEGQDQTL